MLIRFRVANHRSICDEQELSFVAANLKEWPENVVNVEKYGIELLRTVGIYGANASGKSTVLKALSFMQTAVMHSQRSWEPTSGIPREPFLLNPNKTHEPSLFEVDFLIEDIRYTYGFVVTSEKVLEEWLYAYPQGNKQKWFVRDSSEFTFSRFLSGENKAIQSLTRANSLFLSAAAQNNHSLLLPIFKWFSNGIKFASEHSPEMLESRAASSYHLSKHKSGIIELLKSADLGISDIEIEEEGMEEEVAKIFDIFFSDNPDELKRLKGSKLQRASFQHSIKGKKNSVSFPFSDESRGTQVLFCLAGEIIQTLHKGEILCVDELDASLHPLMAVELVKLFNDPSKNPNNAQLLFNTHDTNILEYGNLRRDQIWFTEKDVNGATHLYPLTDYKPRKEENVKRGYMQGRYGGVPFIRTPETLFQGEANGKS
ncbi:MAG TPA: ATP-binding protein [Pyrinomonadaceae bacterium]|nr:ATP-binding protein [Pyrinomonadaceae bacterium]